MKKNPHAATTIEELVGDRLMTPRYIVDELEKKLNIRFQLDACATRRSSKAEFYISRATDALKVRWRDQIPVDDHQIAAVFMNPPYSAAESPCEKNCKKKICEKRGHHRRDYKPGLIDWVAKAADESLDGLIVVGLLPDDRSTVWYQTHVAEKADLVMEPDKRVSFQHPDTGKPIKGNSRPSLLAVWTPWRLNSLKRIPLRLP